MTKRKIMPWLGAATVVAASVLVLPGAGSAAREVADTQTPAVEDFTHPGAERILAEHGLKVFKGDGHIVFVTSRTYDEGQCATGQIQVEKALEAEPYGVYYCFRTRGTAGFLTLEVPATFGIRGGDKPIEATAELPDGERTWEVPPNAFVAVEPGSGGEIPQAVLVELRLAAG
ncbi:hypothetical protein ACTMTJ_41765 [Phytohabitans sp. LJ34]|uniref:hypothetical protein n=1 Tax=Phytohabitans sp. LJ34 TaxID=3452217 RepID=UPI003F892D6D